MLETIAPETLSALVAEADLTALENIRAGRGGPFGAILCAGHTDKGLSRIGTPRANAVLATGLATAHAEDQAMDPAHIAELESILQRQGPEKSYVVLATSAEMCPACHAKAEVLSRTLIAEGLLLPNRFLVAYGATYRQSKEAGLNDEPYIEDFMRPAAARLITVSHAERNGLPEPVQFLLTEGADAVIALPDGSLYAGTDERHRHFTLTAELAAINNACAARKKAGHPAPWNLESATLYSFTADPGPMGYAACQWANVKKWVAVAGSDGTQEAPHIPNAALFRAVAQRPYNGPGAAVHIVGIPGFANRAQQEWKELIARNTPGLANYNGIEEG